MASLGGGVMQWKAPSERTQMILLSPIIIPAGVFLLVALLPIIAIEWLQQHFDFGRGKWRPWFAWRPVHCDGFWYGQPSKWVWLETVERHGGLLDDCEYRLQGWKAP